MEPAKAVHLYNLEHFCPLSPILSSHSVTSDEYAYDSLLNVHPGKTHCLNCGVMMIPALSCITRIKYTKRASGQRNRTLNITCRLCNHEQTMGSLLNQKKTVMQLETTRKKKKKRSELASMLASSKTTAPKTLSLFEFMQ